MPPEPLDPTADLIWRIESTWVPPRVHRCIDQLEVELSAQDPDFVALFAAIMAEDRRQRRRWLRWRRRRR